MMKAPSFLNSAEIPSDYTFHLIQTFSGFTNDSDPPIQLRHLPKYNWCEKLITHYVNTLVTTLKLKT